MLAYFRKFFPASSHIATYEVEYQRTIFQKLAAATGILFAAWQITTLASHPDQVYSWKGLLLLETLAASALTFFFLKHTITLAQVTWQVGLVFSIILAFAAYRRAELLLVLTLLPMGVVIVTNCFMAAASEMLILAAAWGTVNWLPGVVESEYILWVGTGGAVLALFGWVIKSNFCAILESYYLINMRSLESLQEARGQRAELQQIQEDLLHANHENLRFSKQLQILNQVAEEARQAKEEFVATVSHELRTPLNMIIGFSEIIGQSPRLYGMKLPPALLADIASIQRNGQHLLDLVNDVLDLSQVETGSMSISREWTSLQKIIDDAILGVRPLFVSKGLYLNVSLPDEDITLHCDSTRIREVIINLLSNAGRFTEQGGVDVKAYQQKDQAFTCIHDTGPGISGEDQKRIFEPFQQLDSSIRRRYGGSGLGLTISRRFVELHGGKMWLESSPGKGTTFSFSLPIQTPQPEISISNPSRWINPYFQYKGRTRPFKAPLTAVLPRYVILEEGDALQHLMKRYLSNAEIVVVNEIDQAIAEITATPTQALIVNCPPSAKEINELRSHGHLPYGIPVLNCWVPTIQNHAAQLEVFRYLIKPVDRETLLATLQEVGQDVSNVLLVDDNLEVIKLFGRILTSGEKKYRILRATNGPQALEMLRSRKPDVMVLDLIMPEMSGFQVLEEKGRDPSIRDIPVLVITSRDPSNTPIVSDILNIWREGGFSIQDLLNSITALSESLIPRTQG